MKKRYQIDQQRAVQEFRQLAHEQNPNLQMVFPLTEVVGLLQEGVGHLMREAGLALMSLVMEEEVKHLAGERHEQHPARRAHRWGKEAGYCVVDGQKVPIERTRLRTPEKREQRLGSYEMFQRSGPLEHAVWDKLMRGLSTRNYGAVVKDFHEAYGVEKSAVSENFIASSREPVARWIGYAIYNPANVGKLEAAFREVLAQVTAGGFGKDELEEGRNAWLQSRTIARTQDAGLAGKLSAYLDLGRTMAFDAELEAKVHGLSLDAVNAAFRKYLDPSQVNMVKAGDFAKKPGS